MDFVRNLRKHLEHVARSEAELLPWELSVDACRRVFLEALRQREEAAPGSATIRDLHLLWMEDDSGMVLVRELARGLHTGLGMNREQIQPILQETVAALLDPERPMSAGNLTALEAARLARELKQTLFGENDETKSRSWWQFPVRYAREVHATRHTDRGICLTPLGQITLSLPARDVPRWLLHLEVAQSPREGHGLSWVAIDEIVSAPVVLQTLHGKRQSAEGLSCSVHDLARVDEMGFLKLIHNRRVGFTYELTESGRTILEEISQRRDTPFDMLAHALLDDETTNTLGVIPMAHLPAYGLAAEGVARQARQYAHELGNLLGSLRMAVDDLVQGDSSPTPGLQRSRERAFKIVDRLSRMKDEMHEVVVRIPVTRAPFDVASCLREALAALNGEGSVIALTVPSNLPLVQGHKQRFVLALTELMRNALRATEGRIADVRVGARVTDQRMILAVEDNGPGVPREHQEAIFVPGFTSRPAGSGQGLALVREVIQQELHGSIVCEQSPLGGARFVIKLPFQSEAVL